jgi:hypothetical protein
MIQFPELYVRSEFQTMDSPKSLYSPECNTPSLEPFISNRKYGLTGTEILLADKGLEFEPSEEHLGTHVSISELHRGF